MEILFGRSRHKAWKCDIPCGGIQPRLLPSTYPGALPSASKFVLAIAGLFPGQPRGLGRRFRSISFRASWRPLRLAWMQNAASETMSFAIISCDLRKEVLVSNGKCEDRRMDRLAHLQESPGSHNPKGRIMGNIAVVVENPV
jgi:hypothetical protein